MATVKLSSPCRLTGKSLGCPQFPLLGGGGGGGGGGRTAGEGAGGTLTPSGGWVFSAQAVFTSVCSSLGVPAFFVSVPDSWFSGPGVSLLLWTEVEGGKRCQIRLLGSCTHLVTKWNEMIKSVLRSPLTGTIAMGEVLSCAVILNKAEGYITV